MPTFPCPSKTRYQMQAIGKLFVLMPRLWKRGAVAVLFLLSLVSFAPAAVLGSKSSISNIIDFRPASFEAKATAKFFYSIDNELKYSDQIDPHAPTLIRGPFTNFQVSPAGNKIAVVVKKQLLIIGAESLIADVGAVDSIYKSFKPIGRSFIRDDDFQWSPDSKSLYLIRDEYYHSKGSQLFSKRGELWRYDLDSHGLHLVLKPFAAFSYFFDRNFGIYYSEPTSWGDLQLKFFNERTAANADQSGSKGARGYAEGSEEGLFYSFSVVDYAKALPSLNVGLTDHNGLEDLIIKDKKYLSVTQGYNWLSGYFFCPDLLRSVFLPGDRFFLLNVPFCGNYKGQLLFDLESGQYQELPRNTVVFSTLNTITFKGYRVTEAGIQLK